MTDRIFTDANGCKYINNEPRLHPPQRKPLTEEIPIGVLTAITNAKLTLLKTAHGYELCKLGPIVAGHGIKETP